MVQIVSLAFTLVIARLLSPSDYGVAAVAFFWTSTLAVLAEMGLGAALVQFRDIRDETLDACFWGIVAVAVACQMLLTVGALLFLERRSTRSLALVLPVAGFSVLFAALRVVPESLLRRHLRLDRVSQSEGAAAAVGLLVAVGFALHGSGVWALVYADLAAGATRAGLTAWFSGWRPRPRFEFKALHQLLRYGLSALGSGLAWSVYSQGDRVVLAAFAHPAAVGTYAMAKLLASLPSEKLVPAVNQLSIPFMARFQENLSELRSCFVRTVRLVTGLVWPATIIFALLADDLVGFFLAAKWLPAVPLIRILALHGMTFAVGTLFAPVMMARYQTGILVRYSVTQLLLLPAAFLVGSWVGGAIGVAWAWTLVYPMPVLWLARRTLVEIALPSRILIAELGWTLGAVATMALSGLTVLAVLAHLGYDQALLRLAVAGPVMVAVYFAIRLSTGGAELRTEILTLLRSVVRPTRIIR